MVQQDHVRRTGRKRTQREMESDYVVLSGDDDLDFEEIAEQTRKRQRQDSPVVQGAGTIP